MVVDMKRITILLFFPLWMLGGVASVELRAGDLLKLNCSVERPDSWTLQQSTATLDIVKLKSSGKYSCTGTFLLSGSTTTCRTGVSINVDTGKEITISNVDYNDAGTYGCLKEDVNEPTEVVVIQNDGPSLQFSVQDSTTPPPSSNNEVSQGNRVTFNCTIRYGGLKSPSMELIYRSSIGNEQVLATSSSGGVPFNSYQIATVSRDYSISSGDRKFDIICRLPSFLNNSAMMKTSTFNTIYGPIRRDPNNPKVTVILSGGYATLNCSVDSYPTANIIWSRIQSGQTSPISGTGDTTRVTEIGDYRCTATNPRTSSSVTLDFAVEAAPQLSGGLVQMTNETLGAIIGAVVGGVVLIVIIAIVAIYCIRRRKEKDDDEKPKDVEFDSHGKPDVVQSDQHYGKDSVQVDSYYDPPATRKRESNGKNTPLDYAELDIDNVPGSRKPVNVAADPTEYATLKHPQASPY